MIVSREPGVVSELRPFNTCSQKELLCTQEKTKIYILHLVSPELPRKVEAWSREEEENWDRISGNSKVLLFNKVLVDSDELLGPDAGMFAYNDSEFAS